MEDYILYGKNFCSLIKTRRSVRAYKSEPVPSKALEAVLEAGTYAPTGGGHQSPTIIAITDPKYRQEIAKLNAEMMGSSTAPYYARLSWFDFGKWLRKYLCGGRKLPETLRGVGAIALGYPAQEAGQPAARKQNYIVRI